MKRIILLLLPLILLIGSCRDKGGIDMAYTDFFNIQSGANTIETHYYESQVISANWETFLGDYELGDIESIRPSFARIRNNDGVSLDFIDRIVIEIYPNQDLSITPWEMAYRDNIPFNTGVEIEIIPGLADFKDEMEDDQFIYRIGLRYRNFPPFNVPIILDFGFTAELK